MNKLLLGFFVAGAVIIGGVYFVVSGGEKREVMHEPQDVPQQATQDFVTPNMQTMSQEELAKVVAAGPKPGTFKAPTTPPPASVTPSGISRAELAKHDTVTDCWVAFEGSVYNVTTFIPKHPGGADGIASTCGTAEKFEEAFIAQHGREKVGMMMKVAPKQGELAQ